MYYKFILFVLLAKEKDPTLFKRIENIKALGRDIWKLLLLLNRFWCLTQHPTLILNEILLEQVIKGHFNKS